MSWLDGPCHRPCIRCTDVRAAKLNAQVLVRGASVEHIMPVAVAAE